LFKNIDFVEHKSSIKITEEIKFLLFFLFSNCFSLLSLISYIIWSKSFINY